MKFDLNDLSPVRKRLSIELTPEEVEHETETVLKGYRRKARIPGFRPGKAPLSVLRSHFAEELKGDVRDRIVSTSFVKAAEQEGLVPLGDPALEDLVYEEGKPVTFKVVFEVRPKIELKGHREVEVFRPATRVTDDEIKAALEEIRQGRAQLVGEDGREAQEGDVVYVDVEGTPGEGDPIRRERMPIEVGSAGNLDAFNEKLLGARAGAVTDVSVDYPAEYGAKHLAGKRVDYRLTVREVKKKVVPDLDDEFAKDLGDFADLAALEAKIRADLEERKRHEAEMATRQAVLDKVLIENPVVLPEVMVEREIRRRLEDFVRNLIMQGIDPEKEKINWEELRKHQEEPARKSVHARLVLDAVAEVESIAVDDEEFDERVRSDAARIGEKVEKLRERLEEQDGKKALMAQMVREKSLDYLTSVANIQYAD